MSMSMENHVVATHLEVDALVVGFSGVIIMERLLDLSTQKNVAIKYKYLILKFSARSTCFPLK